MAIFPEDMMNSSGGGLSLDTIKAKLEYFELQLHELHWQTMSVAEHMAMDTAYNLLFTITDEIVEKIMGYTGIRTKSMNLEPIKNYSPGMPNIVISELMTFAKQLESYGSLNGMPDIENIAQGLSGAASQIKYRLTLS
jgi:hypothetical protein